MDLEEVFSSKPRVKILKLIYALGQLNVSRVSREIKMSYVATAKHLKLFESEGILLERMYGRVKMYRFNEASTKAKAVADLIEAWEK